MALDDPIGTEVMEPTGRDVPTTVAAMGAWVESALVQLRRQDHVPAMVAQLAVEATTALEELVVADEELRVQADELAASRDAIDAERERYADLFEAIPDAVLETDAVGKILDANAHASELLNVPARAVRDKLLVSFVATDDRAAFRRAVRHPPGGEVVLQIERRGGQRCMIAMRVGRHEHAGVSRLLFVLRDLSQAKAVERALEESESAVSLFERLAPLQRLVSGDALTPATVTRFITAAEELLGDMDLVVRLDGADPVTGLGPLGPVLGRAEAGSSEGPTIDAVSTGRAVLSFGVDVGRRWPTVGNQALALEASGVVAVPVLLDGEPIGAVAGWQRDGRRPEEVLPLLDVIAQQLSMASVNAALYHDAVTAGTDLRRALETRGVIERAKGMLMHADGLSVDGAFAALREQSQRTNRKLRDVALDVAENRIPLDALTSTR